MFADPATLKHRARAATLNSATELPTPALNAAFLPYLNQDVFLHYRLDYQMFRIGVALGAVGEVSTISGNRTGVVKKPYSLPEKIVNVGIETSCQTPSVDDEDDAQHIADDNSAEEIAGFIRDLDRFRAGYRRFRRGESKGAEREIQHVARHLTRAHLSLLPAMQLQQLTQAAGRSSPHEPWSHRLASRGYAETEFHVHFGCGKLGLGLLLPAIVSSGKAFALLNHRLNTWEELLDSDAKKVVVRINDDAAYTLTIIRPGEFDEIQNSKAADNGYFVCTDREDEIRALCSRATSFSTSLGPAVEKLGQLLRKALEITDENRPSLFGCENDHKALDRMAEAVKGRVDVMHCMVDRICAERTVENNKILVTAEPDPGTIVVMASGALPVYKPAFAGDSVFLPRIEAQAAYLANRKLTIVNGMHTTLAFMTLSLQQTIHPEYPDNHALLTSATLPEDKREVVFAWAVARVLMILHQHDLQVIKSAHNVSENSAVVRLLLDTPTNTAKTFASFTTIEDTTGRVLAGGLANRWQTRLKPVDEFLMTYDVDDVPLGRTLLKFSGLKESFLIKCVRKLTEETFKFTGMGSTVTVS